MSGNVDIESLFKKVFHSMGIKPNEMIDFDIIDTGIKHREWTGGTVVVDSEELKPDPNHLIKYRGRNVLLYIRDQAKPNLNKYDAKHYISDYRIHVTWCTTLMTKYNDGTFKKYVVSTEARTLWQVNVICKYNQVVETMQELKVCKNCLNILNYHGFKKASKLEKERIHETFSFEDFFEEYGENESDMKEIPTYTPTSAPLNISSRKHNSSTLDIDEILDGLFDDLLESRVNSEESSLLGEASVEDLGNENPTSRISDMTDAYDYVLDDTYMTESDLLNYLRANEIEFFDKRHKGGALWIVGGYELKPILDKCKDIGFEYSYRGGKATKGRAAWWSK